MFAPERIPCSMDKENERGFRNQQGARVDARRRYGNRRYITALLVVLVVVAGILASGAQAQGGAPAYVLFDPDANSDRFGDRIAFHGNTLVVSAPRTASIPGGVLIYRRTDETTNRWTLEREIQEPASPGNSAYAVRVAVMGDIVAVTYMQSVYILQRDLGGVAQWGLAGQVASPGGDSVSGFGESLILTSDLLIVGAPLQVNEDDTVGAVYLFNRTQGAPASWPLLRKLTPNVTGGAALFGDSTAQSQDWLAVSAPAEERSGSVATGAIYLFQRDAAGSNNWGMVRRVTLDDPASPQDQLAMEADTLVVAKPLANVNGRERAGAVHVLMRNQGGANAWGASARVTDPTPAVNEGFGMAVAITGNALIVSRENTDGSQGSSAIVVFARASVVATEWEVLRSQVVQGLTGYGREIAVHGDTVMVSAPWHNVHGEANRGMVFSYRRDIGGEANWGLAATIVGPGCFEDCGTDYYAAEAVSLINGEREKVECPDVRINPLLDQTALGHSTDMATRDFYSHQTPEGVNFDQRVQEAGYHYALAGEVLFKAPQTPEEAVRGWMASPPHRDILLNCDVTEIGMGVWSSPNSGNLLFWTGVVGRPSTDFLQVPPPGVTAPPIDGRVPYALRLQPQSVLEGLAAGSVVGNLATEDLDLPDDFHTYRLVGGSAFPGNAAFTILGDTLRTARVLSHAHEPKLEIRIETMDAMGNTLEASFTVEVARVSAVEYMPLISSRE